MDRARSRRYRRSPTGSRIRRHSSPSVDSAQRMRSQAAWAITVSRSAMGTSSLTSARRRRDRSRRRPRMGRRDRARVSRTARTARMQELERVEAVCRRSVAEPAGAKDVLCDGLSVPERDPFGAGLELGPKEELATRLRKSRETAGSLKKPRVVATRVGPSLLDLSSHLRQSP